jgi:hypothetical protein
VWIEARLPLPTANRFSPRRPRPPRPRIAVHRQAPQKSRRTHPLDSVQRIVSTPRIFRQIYTPIYPIVRRKPRCLFVCGISRGFGGLRVRKQAMARSGKARPNDPQNFEAARAFREAPALRRQRLHVRIRAGCVTPKHASASRHNRCRAIARIGTTLRCGSVVGHRSPLGTKARSALAAFLAEDEIDCVCSNLPKQALITVGAFKDCQSARHCDNL